MQMTCSNADGGTDTAYFDGSRGGGGGGGKRGLKDLEGGFWQACPQVGAS